MSDKTDKTYDAIPSLSKEDIELKAEEVIEFFDRNILKKASLTPIIEFISILSDKFSLVFDCNSNLGYTERGSKILGLFKFNPRTILIDRSLLNDIRFKFVLGHELGHFVLHRKININPDDYNTIKDTEIDFVLGRKILKSPRDWIEWQANYFSSTILMPRATFRNAVIKSQMDMGINRNLGEVYLENTPYSLNDFNSLLNELADIYDVNRTNIEYRMNTLGILVDKRSKNVKHISELFYEK